jgi:hypothetical protein
VFEAVATVTIAARCTPSRIDQMVCLAVAGGGHQLKVLDGRSFLGETVSKEQCLALLRGKKTKPRRMQLRTEAKIVIQGKAVGLWHFWISLQRHGIALSAGVRWLVLYFCLCCMV